MTIRNCRVLKHSELEALSETLNNILSDWCSDWMPKNTDATVTKVRGLSVQDPITNYPQAEYLAAWSNDSWCALLSERSNIELAGQNLLGYSNGNNGSDISMGPILQSIVDDALLDLSKRIVAGGEISIDAVPVKSSKKVAIPIDAVQPWSGAVITDVTIASIDMSFMLSGSVVENIIPRKLHNAPNVPLAEDIVIQGIRDKNVETQIKLKPANLSIGALSKLSPGDVLVLEHKVDSPFKLMINDSNKHCTGYLGKQNGKYAIKLDALVNIGRE